MTQLAPSASNPPYALSPEEIANAAAYHVEINPALKCCATLRMGFFFDGTDNNRERDMPYQRHSNVARLYDVFDDVNADIRSSVRIRNRFRTYVAGVGTPFKKEVGDPGTGLQREAGLATGWGGESRIVWALLQLQNHVHRFYFDHTLSEALGYGDSELKLLKQACQDQHISVLRMHRETDGASEPFVFPWERIRQVTVVAYKVANTHNYDDARRQLLRERTTELSRRLARWRRQKPTVEAIHLSVFGFSRGAAEARVFVNWLREALDAGGMTLAGIPLRVIFVGLFDTVASVGFSQALAEGFITGHGGWAEPQNLVIPDYVEKCLHLVAAHEVRGSFPLDAANVEQYVYPGVHADVGGCYAPGEQGRSPRDADKLSQITLGHMYRAAVAAGVPLNMDAPEILDRSRQAMQASDALISAFNAYIAATREVARGGLVPIMHALYGQYIRWRRLRLDTLPDLPTTRRAAPQERRDLIDANEELREEARALADLDRAMAENQAHYSLNPGSAVQMLTVGAVIPPHLPALFSQLIEHHKVPEWRQVRVYWNHPLHLHEDRALVELFDNYVHDSRASFKPLASGQKVWRRRQETRMRQLQYRQARFAPWNADRLQWQAANPGAILSGSSVIPPVRPLSQQEAADLAWYEKTGQLPLNPGGREFSLTWGYLRWRVIFDGDSAMATDSPVRLEMLRQEVAPPLGASSGQMIGPVP